MSDYASWLQDWFRQKNPAIAVAGNANYFESGAIDSLGVIELIEDIEQTFSIRFTQNDFQDRRFASIDGLSAIIAEKKV